MSKEHPEDRKFNYNDPVFEKQRQYLNRISREDLNKLFEIYEQLKAIGYDHEFMNGKHFHKLHKLIYDLKIIFDFKWATWDDGWKDIYNSNYDYSESSLLELSMYLTTIFRADRFSEGTIEENFRNGTLDKIFERMLHLTSPRA